MRQQKVVLTPTPMRLYCLDPTCETSTISADIVNDYDDAGDFGSYLRIIQTDRWIVFHPCEHRQLISGDNQLRIVKNELGEWSWG